jgi:anaerobic selenocysteine-containing dehydrogenase
LAEIKKSYCRVCSALCGIEVEVKDNRVLTVRGDPTHPITGGYTCIKGRNMPEQHNYSGRLRTALKRMPDGSFRPLSSAEAMDEIAEKLRGIIRAHGPRAVASYTGTPLMMYAGGLAMVSAWHKGLGSPSMYMSTSIDQPGKKIALFRHGAWEGGEQSFDQSDVFMFIGCNPLISMFAGRIFKPFNPWKQLSDAKKRGLKLIVIDPRRTEVAKRADLHLQLKPGEDPTLLAGLIQVILREGLQDHDFCAANVDGVGELREATADFTPHYVEARTGVPANQVVAAARMFGAGTVGCATSGTGPSMAPRSNLSEQLILTLNTLCGRYLREGDTVANPGTLTAPPVRRAQVSGGGLVPQLGPRSRIKGLGAYLAGGDMPTTVLADEMLRPGEGQLRALITLSGNPVGAWPDQRKTIAALRSLELNVAIDVRMSQTTRECDYVLPAKLGLERPDMTLLADTWFPQPFAQYTPAIVDAEGDLMEEWEFLWGLAQRLGTGVELPGGPMPMDTKPSSDEYLDLLLRGSRVPLHDVRLHPGGAGFPAEPTTVQPRDPSNNRRLQAGHPEVLAELREVRAEALVDHGGYRPDELFSHRLISRRLREVSNSAGRDLASVRQQGVTTNFAYMNPQDLSDMHLTSGDVVRISSETGSILGVAQATDDVRPGVISMAHGWGDTPENDHLVRSIGGSTSRLVTLDRNWEPYTGMGRQSAIPVNVCAAVEDGPK